MAVRIVPVSNSDGSIHEWVGMSIDITGQKQGEDEERARFAAIVQSSDDAIISKDLNGVITSWNKGAERLFGYTAQEAVGKSVTLLIPPERFEEEPAILERIRRGEPVDHYETVRRRKDGTLIDVSLTVSPIVDSQGQVVGASKIARDITERKQAEELLREEDRRKNEFLAMLAHELRNPLAPDPQLSGNLAAKRGKQGSRPCSVRDDGTSNRPDGAAGRRLARCEPYQPRQD